MEHNIKHETRLSIGNKTYNIEHETLLSIGITQKRDSAINGTQNKKRQSTLNRRHKHTANKTRLC